MKRILLSGLGFSLLGLLTACGGGGSRISTTGTNSTGGGGTGGDTSSCLGNIKDPVSANGSCYTICSSDNSFCLKDDEMPSQSSTNKAIKICQQNSILIDDQCQEITLSIQGDKNNIYYSVSGNTTNTNIIYDQSTYDSSSGKWNGQFNETFKYIKRDYGGVYNYYWQTNLPTFVFPTLTSTGFDFGDGNILNAYSVSPYTQMLAITPVIKFGSLTLDTSQYKYSDFANWCNALNNEWPKFEDPTDPGNPPQFTIKILDDRNGGNYIQCSADIEYSSNKMFKNKAPYIDNFEVMFDCNYQNNNDCKLYGFGSFNF